MIVAALMRPESTIRRRNWPADSLLADSRQIRREIALKALLRKRSAVAEQTQADLPVGDDRTPACGIAGSAGERSGNRIAHYGDRVRRVLRVRESGARKGKTQHGGQHSRPPTARAPRGRDHRVPA